MKTIWTVIHWIISTLFLLLFFSLLLNNEILSAIIYWIWTILFIPQFQGKTFEKVKKHKTLIKIISFVFISIIWTSFSDIEQKQESKTVEKIQDQEFTIEKEINNTEIKKYRIIESDDISIPTAKRYRVHVVIETKETSEELIKDISEEIINEYKINQSNATVIYYYMHKTEIGGWYTLAKAEWAPNGIWAEAYLKINYKTVYDFKKYVWKTDIKTPTEEERQITKKIRDLYYKMNNWEILVSENEIYKILSPKLNKTLEELEEIHTKVTFFEMWY